MLPLGQMTVTNATELDERTYFSDILGFIQSEKSLLEESIRDLEDQIKNLTGFAEETHQWDDNRAKRYESYLFFLFKILVC